MNKPLSTLLSVMAALAIVFPARGLTIVATFDSSIVNDAHSAAIMSAINAAIQVMESNVVDNVTVKITFVASDSAGLGQSSTIGGDYSYANFLNALKSRATSAADNLALSVLPNSSTDPVIGGSQIHLTTPQARLLGLDSYSNTDSTITLQVSQMNFARPPADPNKYDLQQVAEHEMDEVLGIASGLPDTSEVWPVDLFRYTTNRVRTFTTNGDDAYFSVDGNHLIARYNMDPGGDYGDWWSINGNWSPTIGVTPSYPQVQDAFGAPDTALDVGPSELTALDVVGWTLATTAPAAAPRLNIVRSGAGQFTLSWPAGDSGFVLQERTNLDSGTWEDAPSGSTNPAVVTATPDQKFYRLYQSASSHVRGAQPKITPASAKVPLYLVTRVYRPRP